MPAAAVQPLSIFHLLPLTYRNLLPMADQKDSKRKQPDTTEDFKRVGMSASEFIAMGQKAKQTIAKFYHADEGQVTKINTTTELLTLMNGLQLNSAMSYEEIVQQLNKLLERNVILINAELETKETYKLMTWKAHKHEIISKIQTSMVTSEAFVTSLQNILTTSLNSINSSGLENFNESVIECFEVNRNIVLWFHGITWKQTQKVHGLKEILSGDQEEVTLNFKSLMGRVINPFEGAPQPRQPIREMQRFSSLPTVPQATTTVSSTSSGSSSSASSPNINPVP